ncbi:MAG: efflux RND transporter periplasmic adaptor subunit [Candidatus Eisenbacteria bacterium]|uniref:Efflux RND transporter periplasmic adaptor subunit n=1 Tax=Eiseniibacteriota bacterium TaxID=2212470 RepID=A0A956NFL8_UNCEI|nr:efflux RND transporter periplasmic adaptor subunit [Candidatus Eisenbacteria bacterium]
MVTLSLPPSADDSETPILPGMVRADRSSDDWATFRIPEPHRVGRRPSLATATRTLATLAFIAAVVIGSFGVGGCSGGGGADGAGSDSTAVTSGAGNGSDDAKGGNDSKAEESKSDKDDSGKAGSGGSDDDSSNDESGDGSDDGANDRKAREKTTSVDATACVKGDLIVPVVAEGRIRARREAEIRAEIGGRLDRVFVEEGQSVKRGQLLARIDGREYQVAIDEARSRYLKALGQIVIEEEKVDDTTPQATIEEQLEKLWSEERVGRISRDERTAKQREIEVEALKEGSFRRDLVEARTGLSAAKADEERARLNLERTEIRAPFSGVVTGLTWVSGQRVSAGEALCSIVDNVEVEAEVGVLESDLRGLEVGDRALLIVPALAETLDAKVDVISPRIDSTTRTCEVLIRYTSEDGRVRPGMFVRASIAGQTLKDRLLVPREAILTRDGRPLLFRVDGDRSRWVYVTLGEQNDYVVEIKSVLQGGPLNPGTKVVVSDHLTLTDEAKIKIRKTRPISDPWSRSGTES